MLKTQMFLRNCLKNKNWTGNVLERLNTKYGIKYAYSPCGELVVLNYDQIDSSKHKTSPIVRECRGLVLEANTFEVVAKSFYRFFNQGEVRAEDNKFNWNNFSIASKEDGSLILVYNYKGNWRVNTRGSFANGLVNESGQTWEYFVRELIDDVELEEIDENITLVFEFCSIHNKVVRHYPENKLYLLSAFNRKTLTEYSHEWCDVTAKHLGCNRPEFHNFTSLQEIIEFLEKHPDNTFEGFVLKDDKNNRLKIKNKGYLRLHAIKGENPGSPKNIVPFILKNETEELISYFPELTTYVEKYKAILENNLKEILETWNSGKHLTSQKEFAILVKSKVSKMTDVLFQARKLGLEPEKIWRQEEEALIQLVKNEIKL